MTDIQRWGQPREGMAVERHPGGAFVLYSDAIRMRDESLTAAVQRVMTLGLCNCPPRNIHNGNHKDYCHRAAVIAAIKGDNNE